jgi:hypothetical protein
MFLSGNPGLTITQQPLQIFSKLTKNNRNKLLFVGDTEHPPGMPVGYTRNFAPNNKKIMQPFKNLNKPEVVDLYRQLDLVDLLYKTRSCSEKPVRDDKHCGRCFNCQQRFDAFRILGSIDDQTTYVSDTIKINRYKLESVLSLN